MSIQLSELNNLIQINNIFNIDYVKSIIINNFIIDKDRLIHKLNNLNYVSFNHIKSRDDVINITKGDILNFIIDNRHGLNEIIQCKDVSKLSKIRVSSVIRFDNIKNWFNYLYIISIITKSIADKKQI